MISQTGGHGDPWLPSARLAGLLHPHPGVPYDFADLSDRICAIYQDGRLVADAASTRCPRGFATRPHPNVDWTSRD